MAIWTEDQSIDRQFMNMLHPKGKDCKNCYWSGYKKGSDFITCGHHHENFKANSLCSYWTDPKDENLLAYKEKTRQRLIDKLKK